METKEIEEKNKEFRELCEPLVKYLNENHHPHTTIIINPTGWEILEWIRCCKILEFIKD